MRVASGSVILWLAGTIPLAAVPANLVAGPAAVACQAVGSVAATLATLQLPGAVAVDQLKADLRGAGSGQQASASGHGLPRLYLQSAGIVI